MRFLKQFFCGAALFLAALSAMADITIFLDKPVHSSDLIKQFEWAARLLPSVSVSITTTNAPGVQYWMPNDGRLTKFALERQYLTVCNTAIRDACYTASFNRGAELSRVVFRPRLVTDTDEAMLPAFDLLLEKIREFYVPRPALPPPLPPPTPLLYPCDTPASRPAWCSQ